ncbi:hypothetical protein [Paenibacillus herberti]|uniref:Uncharacterized protein n=1 Tax=Paenibacillus herberti TaxID=1619309 RepID=A0A229NU13_9BACL|nr:hypothetical protein [Paenibacillus herberti]OXM13195.1 hypothetical protein CGZ75_23845 [Paenibacillus herberti]
MHLMSKKKLPASGNHNFFRRASRVVILLAVLLSLVSCTAPPVWTGSSDSWKARLTVSDKSTFMYKIDYIGQKELIKGYRVKFLGDRLNFESASDKQVQAPPFYISSQIATSKDKSEEKEIQLTVIWNDKQETMTLRK